MFNASSAAGVSSANEAEVLVGPGFKEGRTGPAASRPKTTTVAYGKGAKDAADRIAARYGATAAESASAAAGHVVVTLGTAFTGVASDRPTSAPTDPGTNVAQQGPVVDARPDGGIPCVFWAGVAPSPKSSFSGGSVTGSPCGCRDGWCTGGQ
ncbi:LytR C-terminal domain-containing protein [Kitasatospora sp. NPDC059648]|uniref:LytR C-terminal domain-containing protein n=1 Tax=Kitasatospora sp. NPDC059648 TaxID=3346894 RepID=UPI0036866090